MKRAIRLAVTAAFIGFAVPLVAVLIVASGPSGEDAVNARYRA